METGTRHSPSSLTGLFVALVVPVFYTVVVAPILAAHGNGFTEVPLGLFVMWLVAAAVVAIVKYRERRPLSSIGWHLPSRRTVVHGLVIGLVLSLAVPLLTVLSNLIIPPNDNGSIAMVVEFPWWLTLLSVITAGITEELLFRGYALERLLEWIGSKWISSGVSLIGFGVIYATGWNLGHIIGIVIPLGIVLTGLYWWRRSVVLVMIVHLTINAPLVFLSLASE